MGAKKSFFTARLFFVFIFIFLFLVLRSSSDPKFSREKTFFRENLACTSCSPRLSTVFCSSSSSKEFYVWIVDLRGTIARNRSAGREGKLLKFLDSLREDLGAPG